MNKSLVPFVIVGCCVVSAGAPIVFGQTTVAPPASEAGTDEVTKLTPFEVTTDRDTAYRANHAVSSNRSNTSIFDAPRSITVLTEAFLRLCGARNYVE